MQKSARNALTGIVLLSLCVCLVLIFGGIFRLKNSEDTRNEALSRLSAVIEERDTLEAQLAELREQQPADSAESAALLADLEQKPELIPIGAELGGTMRYYPDTFSLFGDHYAYIYAEDGHNAVEMMLEYRKTDDGAIAWALCAYNAGSGWQAA